LPSENPSPARSKHPESVSFVAAGSFKELPTPGSLNIGRAFGETFVVFPFVLNASREQLQAIQEKAVNAIWPGGPLVWAAYLGNPDIDPVVGNCVEPPQSGDFSTFYHGFCDKIRARFDADSGDAAQKPARLTSRKNRHNGERKPLRRERGPAIEKHRERVNFENALITDLASIRDRCTQSPEPTPNELREMLPSSKLWEILQPDEQKKLVSEEFKPKGWARRLTARKFGVSEDTVKKSRHRKHTAD
jgi:hypothetical protein